MRFSLRCSFYPIAVCAIALLAGCVNGSFSPRRTTLTADRVNLPTTKEDEGLWIEVRINGAGPFLLLVDTGCTVTLLPQRVADAAGLKLLPKWEMPVVNAAGVTSASRAAWVKTFESGGLRLDGLFVGVKSDVDFAAISALHGRAFDGAVGMDTLKDIVLEMDFPAGQVTAVRHGGAGYPDARGVAYRETVPRVLINAAGKEIDVEIDTGANGGFSLPKLDEVPLLYPKVKAIGGGAVFGKTSGKRGDQGQLAGEAKLGPLTWVNPPLSGMGHESKEGRLGVAALDTWKLVIDQKKKQVFFLGGEPTRTWEKEEPADVRFSPGYFVEVEGNALRLVEVDAGGAADLAGLRNGDLVLEIDGSPAVRGAWKSERPKYRVQRAGTEFETRLVVVPDYTARQTILAANRVELPTFASRGALLLETRINGAGPYRLLVASGERSLRLGKHIVDAAKLKPFEADSVVWVESLKAGGLELRGLAAVVTDAVGLARLNSLHGKVDGVIGLEPLRDLLLEADLAGGQLSAIKPGAETFPESRAVPYAPKSETPMVVLSVEGHETMALIDTASTGGFELPTTLVEILPLFRTKVKEDGMGFAPSSARSERGQIDGTVRAGPISWVNSPIMGRAPARIGTGVLGAWKLVFDQQAHRVFFLGPLERRAREVVPVPMSRFRAGYFARLEEQGLRLIEVDAGGAFATAGLREGDLILAVDELSAVEFARRVGAFSTNRQRPQKLRVRRDGMEFDATLILAPEAQ